PGLRVLDRDSGRHAGREVSLGARRRAHTCSLNTGAQRARNKKSFLEVAALGSSQLGRGIFMFGTKVLRSLAAILAAVLVVFSYSDPAVAQTTDAATQAKMRDLQQRLEELSKELQSLKAEQAKTAADQAKMAADQQK